jgi:branched-chain amino acid transport system permease protein
MSKSPRDHQVAPSTVLGAGAKIGLIGGVIAVAVALEGMLQAFATRDIISGIISMSQVLLLITFFASAYVAVIRSGSSQSILTLITGALSGLISSVFLVALIGLGSVVNLGAMFIHATPDLYGILTFKQGAITGSLYLLGLGLVMGAAAAIIYLVPSNTRRPIVFAVVGVVSFGLLQDLIRVTLSGWPALTPATRFLYKSNGLSIEGMVTLFVLIMVFSYIRSTQGSRIQTRLDSLPPARRRALRWAAMLTGVAILFLLPAILGLYLSEVMDNVGIYLLMGLGLNIVVGFAGLLDLGYVAFYAIGAYTAGVLTSPELSTGIIHNWWGALPFAVVIAVFAGVVLGIPVLKMRGDYLAIVTLGFGEIIRLLALSDFLKPWIGGAQGIQGIAKPNIGPLQINWGPQQFYYIILAGCLLVAFVAIRLKNSRLGRAWMAVREDEDVAQAMGINLVATKLLAFGMGASFGGLSGAIFASKLESAYPQSFNFLVSVNVLSLIIIGGMGSIPGVVLGALALVGLPELLREVGDYRYLFYGAVLVVMMLVRPEGLWPEAIRKRELHESEAAETGPALVGAPVQSKGEVPVSLLAWDTGEFDDGHQLASK